MISLYHTLEFDRVREKLAGCASSPLGAERAQGLEPIHDEPLLATRMRQTTEMRDTLDYDQSLPMDGIHDLRPLVKQLRVGGSFLQPEELLLVLQTLGAVRRLHFYLSGRREKNAALWQIASGLIPLESLEKEIRRCIDENAVQVKDDASPELASLRKQIIRAQNHARQKMEAMVRNLGSQGMLQENVITVRNGRLVLMVKDDYKRKVRGLVLDQSASGSSLFIEPLEALEDNNHIRELQAEETREVERILRALSDKIRGALSQISTNVERLGELDLIYSQGVLSRLLQGHAPELVSEPLLAIAGGRHPLLLLRMGEKNVIPLDVTLGEDFATLIISGPNAGGKTVALKTVGLLTLMARCGLHIPALPHTRIGAIEHIFASIGDQQSIDNDLSTFSSHLESLREISEAANDHSLVLIDEIGSGTDPEEGSALAMSLLEKLTTAGALSLVTTHQSALKAFAYRTERVENGSMEFDVETLKPTYRFRTGIPGSSYAFEIASRMGLQEALIARARELVGAQKDRLEGLILELESKIQHYQTLSREAGLRETEFRGLAKLYQERSDMLKKEEKALKRKAAAEAEEILQQANAAVEQSIREIKEKNAEREAIRTAKERLSQQREKVIKEKKIVQADDTPVVINGPAAKGDYVRWEKMSGTGEVISEPDQQGRVLVRVGGVKIKAPLLELQKVSSAPQKRQTISTVMLEKPEAVKNEIDLRGLRADEALERVQYFLDEAYLAGFSEVRIIHGKGTGALRASIGKFLRTSPRVESARLGNWNEGDSGVTVVALKAG